jgi:hypothetical protein
MYVFSGLNVIYGHCIIRIASPCFAHEGPNAIITVLQV